MAFLSAYPLLGNAFLWPFSVPIHWRSNLTKQSRDPDIVGRVQNGTCQARVSEKMRYVNVKVHDNRRLLVKANKTAFLRLSLDSPSQQPLLRWWRSIMLMCPKSLIYKEAALPVPNRVA